MKLTEIRLVAHTGTHESLYSTQHPREDGERSYFPHVHVGSDECARPRYFLPAGCHPSWSGRPWTKDDLVEASSRHITFNEGGDYAATHETHDALAELFAAAPRLLHLLSRSLEWITDDDRDESHALVKRLMAYEIQPRGDGWGPYYNADGAPYEEMP